MELQVIQSKIYEIRGYKVMLDYDLAELYQVETRVLNQAVNRNSKRFPPDFMFQLTDMEFKRLISQFVTSSWGGRRKPPLAFTEQGLAMLSGVLNSDIAIEVNINIMRAFVTLRQFALGYAELKQQLDNFMLETNLQFNEIYLALTELAEQKRSEHTPRNPIGFRWYEKE
ncbi:hypothetical protein EZS27_005671 [termite gut metagenome]|uniref:KilA-N DNA-binding domain-containing protein n=1 Tax=termite gut metagenome TaxID=433724 RepID=A0A5J4SN11_9ZZZZ